MILQLAKKKMVEHPRADVAMHLLDLRNHGNSPHSDNMNYELMVEDVAKYIEDKQLEKVMLIGHSMVQRALNLLFLFFS